MSDWTGGYVADIAYTHGYYPELNPQRLKLAFLASGHAFPEAGTACELGYGQGVSTNVHAAASVTQWYGTDFNPTQAGYAQDLAAASGAHARLFDQGFEEFCRRTDLPDFDFIGLHGIWSWVSDANRHIIAEFIRRKLKVGGVVYISYNTQPGWAPIAPLRNLLAEHAQVMGNPGSGIVPRVEAALAFAEKLVGSGAKYGQANPQVAERLAALKKQNRNYLAHEYFNRDWVPMPFTKVSAWLGESKLSFVASATYTEHVPAINLSPEQQELLREVADPTFRETVRDFLVNQQFRKDYWVRGPRTLAPQEQVELLRRQRFVLVVPRDRVSMMVNGALGEATLQEAIYGPLLARLADHRPCSVQHLEEAVQGAGIGFGAVLQALLVLVGKGVVEPVQDDRIIDAAAPAAARLNRKLCEQARYSNAVTVLASPVTGGGIGLGQIEKLVLLARAQGMADTEAAARSLVQAMEHAGQRFTKEGKVLEAPEAVLAEAVRAVRGVDSELMPMLTALGIAL